MAGCTHHELYAPIAGRLIHDQSVEFYKRYKSQPRFVKVSAEAFKRFNDELNEIYPTAPETPDDGTQFWCGLKVIVVPELSGLTGIEVF